MFGLVLASTLRDLQRRYDRADALLGAARESRDHAESLAERTFASANDLFARTVQVLTDQLVHAQSGARRPEPPIVEPVRRTIEPLPPDVERACEAYAYGSVKELVANRRLARALLAQELPEHDVIARIVRGQSELSDEAA